MIYLSTDVRHFGAGYLGSSWQPMDDEQNAETILFLAYSCSDE